MARCRRVREVVAACREAGTPAVTALRRIHERTRCAVPKPEEGDVLAIRDVGAYGWSMASSYNLRPRPAEVLVRPGGPQVIREREPLDAISH